MRIISQNTMIDGKTLKRDARFYVENFLKIRTKDGEIELLKMKPAQRKLYETIQKMRDDGQPVRIVILKARQLGFSTLIEALYFQQTATHKNIRTLIVAHDDDSTTNLFRMNKRFYDLLPDWLKPDQMASNAKEIILDNPTRDMAEKKAHPGLGSSIRCVPATGESVGRSDTLTNVHASEVAFWRDMEGTFTALFQAVPNKPNTSIIIETTPNGYNSFKTFWDNASTGKNGFVPLFFPWYDEPDYRMPCEADIEWTPEELDMKRAYGLDDEQLKWRRWCIANNFNGDSEKFKQEYASCPEECFLASGNPFFDNAKIINRLNELTESPTRASFVYGEDSSLKPLEAHLEEDKHGTISIYERVEERHPYVIGGDTAGDGSDRFTMYVIDNSTGEQVAMMVFDGNSEIYYTQQLYALGKYYNDALIGVEINFSTYPEKKLEEWGYPHLYIREKPDDARGQLSTYKWGWRTDMRTRPLILANLQTLVRQNIELIKDRQLLQEMLTFIRNENMRAEAAEGEHDDMVMACAICYGIRDQQTYEVREAPKEEYVMLIDRLDPKHKYRRR